VSGALTLLLAQAAAAQSEAANCWNLELPEQHPAYIVQVNDSVAQLHFLKNEAAANGCPARTAHCEQKAYLVPGDRAIVVGQHADFVCVGFVGAKGRITVGWLPLAALRKQDSPELSAAEWAGNWRRDAEADLQIEALDDDLIVLSGDATWGASDPARVERGAVNIGEIESTEVQLETAVVHVQAGQGAIDPKQAEDYSCVLSMQRIAEVLLVRDNSNCGGMNVRFNGVYLRR
jgi:hypothetical protein